MTNKPDAAWSFRRNRPISRRKHEAEPPSDTPVVQTLLQRCADASQPPATLLAVCPNSKAVTRAALHAAQEADAPLLLAATLNQVDRDGGYTGWTPSEFVQFVTRESKRIGVTGLVLPCLDHGGPWLKDKHAAASYSYEETMAAVKQSIEACIEAGYALLHIDPTVDPRQPDGQPLPIEQVVERTVELIAHAEAYRTQHNRRPIDYEVGTEEVQGGLADLDTFDAFLQELDQTLTARGMRDAWPCFVVGKVGTDLDTSTFEPSVARQLAQRVRPYNAHLKGHYTDYVANPEEYPLSGMGGANVGPEFTEVEYEALVDLVHLERKVCPNASSGLREALRDAVVQSGRWTKWLHPAEEGASFDALDERRQQWLVRTGSRYVWRDPSVLQARRRLYENLNGYRNAEAYVIWRIKTAIMAYFHAFNLVGFNQRLR